MSNETSPKPKLRLPLLLTLILLAVVTVFFLIEFVAASTTPPEGVATTLTADTYQAEVAAAMVDADPQRGETLVKETYECHVCHMENGGQIAPTFEGLGARASEERPPLTAEAYLYEAIVYPTAHVVEGYSAAMPANYLARMSSQELGDVIAYLLTQ